jgi:hypothetical protein
MDRVTLDTRALKKNPLLLISWSIKMFDNKNSLKLATTGILAFIALTAILAPTTASAALVAGEATLTIDNAAVSASNPGAWFFQTHWGSSDNALTINGSTTGGTALSTTGSTALLFPVNTNTVTQVLSTVVPGRTLQATTMDASHTAVGQIGLSGAMRLRDPGLASYLGPYDLSLKKIAGTWTLQTFDSQFQFASLFALGNVSESLNGNGELLLTGDLLWANTATGLTWANNLLGANTSTVIGSFSLAPSAVPVPAAVWLFGSGLMGLFGATRRKTVIAA